jgi:short subunit dehydrogenase-like uncharacterized protein
MKQGLLIYGAYGYTGELIVEEAMRHGLRPTLSGRDYDRTAELAQRTGLLFEAVRLDDRTALDRLVGSHAVVIHAAGPFIHTVGPMADACLRNGTHYLDITGEIDVFAHCHGLDAKAKTAKVMLMPGTGFDVVPSDCLAAHLAARLPMATELRLAFYNTGRSSRGTSLTVIESLGTGSRIRKEGKLVNVPLDHDIRAIDYDGTPRLSASIAWGDVYTAYLSTGIGNVKVYMAMPEKMIRSLRLNRYFGWVIGSKWFKKLAADKVRSGPAGPTPAQRKATRALLWGQATAPDGTIVTSRLQTPEGYTLTARTAVAMAMQVLNGNFKAGYCTPSQLMGPDFIATIEGVNGFTDE